MTDAMTDAILRVRALATAGDAPMLACLLVYGCQQNEADGDRLRGMLCAMGFGLTDDHALADLLVVNACAVREHAEKRVLGHLGACLRGARPGRQVVVCGCMAQRPEVQALLKRSYRQVSLAFGPGDLALFPSYLLRLLTEGGRHFYLGDPTAPIAEDLPALRAPPPRAWVSVMTGCDNYCSYCVVPYVRGRERSRPPEAVLREIEGLVGQGYSEIWLLGQNVNSYKPDFPGLLRTAARLPGDFVLRFMTSHPRDATPRLFEAMRDCPRVAPFLHLPVQSGSDAVLAAMNRGYTRAGYLAAAAAARETVPGLNLTSDVIVGFPGETEADFEDTLDLLRRVRFNSLFTFRYSPRAGTPAALLPPGADEETVSRRFERLLAEQKAIEMKIGKENGG